MTKITKINLKGLGHFALNVKDMKRPEEKMVGRLGIELRTSRLGRGNAGLTSKES